MTMTDQKNGCARCQQGLLFATGEVITVNPPMYVHRCDVCGTYVKLLNTLPVVARKREPHCEAEGCDRRATHSVRVNADGENTRLRLRCVSHIPRVAALPRQQTAWLLASPDVVNVIAVDFDGTCVTHAYPHMGRDIGAAPVLRRLGQQNRLVLWTMRDSEELDAAVRWFADNHIALWAVNHNPEQHMWTTSRKAYANLYIDDAAMGVPLRVDHALSPRPFVDWTAMESLLVARGVLTSR